MPLLPLSEIDYRREWTQFLENNEGRYASVASARKGFIRHVKTIVIAPHVQYVPMYALFCADCRLPGLRDHMYSGYTTRGRICRDCVGAYIHCSSCNVWYKRGSSNQHRHRRSNCCRSMQPTFTIPASGDPVPNDTRISISLPAGEISEEGIEQIAYYLQRQANDAYYALNDGSVEAETERNRAYRAKCAVANALDTLGDKWQTRQGNYAKRLSRMAYNDHQIKITPEEMTYIGNIASQHSNGADHEVEFTRQLNQGAASFVHAGSCWWTSYSSSRCAFKTQGGYAMRAYNPDRPGARAVGRAWIMPLKRTAVRGTTTFIPTYNVTDADAHIVFNGYGSLSGYTPSRILSQIMGVTYRKVGFSASPMYLNGGGYLVGAEDVISEFTDKSVNLSLEAHSPLWEREQREQRTLETARGVAASIPGVTDAMTDLGRVTQETAMTINSSTVRVNPNRVNFTYTGEHNYNA